MRTPPEPNDRDGRPAPHRATAGPLTPEAPTAEPTEPGLLPIPEPGSLGETAPVMEPVEESTPRRALRAAREPLSLRFLLAFSASTVLTAAVAVPMAVQAHLAREEQGPPAIEAPVVLGTTTVPADPANLDPDGLFVRAEDGDERSLLDGAEVSGEFEVLLDAPDAVRVDFVLDDGDVVTDRVEPWAPFPGEGDDPQPTPPEPLPAGEHVLTAAVTYADGRVELRRARFTVVPD